MRNQVILVLKVMPEASIKAIQALHFQAHLVDLIQVKTKAKTVMEMISEIISKKETQEIV